MPKILAVAGFDLPTLFDRIQRGEEPDHSIYGLNYLANMGFEIECVQSSENLIDLPVLPYLGSIKFQRQYFKRLQEFDLIYALQPKQVESYQALSGMGMDLPPLVVIGHHQLNAGRLRALRSPFFKLMMNGTARYVCLCNQTCRSLNEMAGRELAFTLPWGPDAEYYKPFLAEGGTKILSTGRLRDHRVLALGANKAQVKVDIIAQEDFLYVSEKERKEFSPYINWFIQPQEKDMEQSELMECYKDTIAVAISTIDVPGHLAGTTSLNESMAMGKATLMTKLPSVDIDIEKEGIGLWVEPGSADSWAKALRFIHDNPDKALEMGRRGRALVDNGFSSKTFANQLADLFNEVISESKAAKGSKRS